MLRTVSDEESSSKIKIVQYRNCTVIGGVSDNLDSLLQYSINSYSHHYSTVLYLI